MTVDQTINAWLAPIADWLGKVVFFTVPGRRSAAAAHRGVAHHGRRRLHARIPLHQPARLPALGAGHSRRLFERKHPGEATPFQALSTAVSGTVGLGSIGGVAVAVTLGGPGAAFWMVVAGFLGMSLKFAEVTLAVKYRRVRADGTVTGGAMYYVPEALKRARPAASRQIPRRVLLRRRRRRLGHDLPGEPGVFAGHGRHRLRPGIPVRAHRRDLDRHRAVRRREAHREMDRQALAVHVPAVHRGLPRGARRELHEHSCRRSPPSCARHSRRARSSGGIVGALIQGFRRAAFANEAGIGSAPMAHATVRTNEPMSQGFAALMEPFLDTVIICLLTALVVVVSGVNHTSDERRHRAHLRRVRHRRAVVPDGARGRRGVVRAVHGARLGLLRRAGLDLAVLREQGAAASRTGCSCAACCRSRPRSRLDQVVNIVDSCSFLHGHSEHHRHLSDCCRSCARISPATGSAWC